MDSLRITRNDIPDARKMLRAFVDKGVPRLAARVLRRNIIERTNRGVDYIGARFVPYSKAYAKYGRKNRHLQVRPVNLTVTAKMKNSLSYHDKIQVFEGTGKALAVGSRENPRAVGNQALRQWVGVKPSDVNEMKKEIQSEFLLLKIGDTVPTYSVK